MTESHLSKAIVRRLPPDLTLKSFSEVVGGLPKHNYLYFVTCEKPYQLYSFSRVYINFVNYNELVEFKEKFDNYVFVDSKGNARLLCHGHLLVSSLSIPPDRKF